MRIYEPRERMGPVQATCLRSPSTQVGETDSILACFTDDAAFARTCGLFTETKPIHWKRSERDTKSTLQLQARLQCSFKMKIALLFFFWSQKWLFLSVKQFKHYRTVRGKRYTLPASSSLYLIPEIATYNYLFELGMYMRHLARWNKHEKKDCVALYLMCCDLYYPHASQGIIWR